MASLGLLTNVKSRLNFSQSTHDTLLGVLLEQATAAAERVAGRPLLRDDSVTEYPQQIGYNFPRTIKLKYYPIESVTTVKELGATSTDAQFTAASALTEITDYVIHSTRGVLERINASWMISGPRHVQVVYAGGYIDPVTDSPPAGSIQPPDDLQGAIESHVVWLWNTRDTAGLREIAAGDGGSVSLAESKLHPELVAVARSLRRVEI